MPSLLIYLFLSSSLGFYIIFHNNYTKKKAVAQSHVKGNWRRRVWVVAQRGKDDIWNSHVLLLPLFIILSRTWMCTLWFIQDSISSHCNIYKFNFIDDIIGVRLLLLFLLLCFACHVRLHLLALMGRLESTWELYKDKARAWVRPRAHQRLFNKYSGILL